VLVVEVAEIRFGDALVGSDRRPHAAIEPDHGFLHRRGRSAARCEYLRRRVAVGGREIENLAASAHEAIAPGLLRLRSQ
jgi:hypothetical protein